MTSSIRHSSLSDTVSLPSPLSAVSRASSIDRCRYRERDTFRKAERGCRLPVRFHFLATARRATAAAGSVARRAAAFEGRFNLSRTLRDRALFRETDVRRTFRFRSNVIGGAQHRNAPDTSAIDMIRHVLFKLERRQRETF